MYLDCARQCSRRCAKVGHAVACARNAAQIARRNRELLIFVFTGRGGTLIILILSQTLVSSLYKEDLFADLLKVSEQQKFLQSFFFVSSHLFHPSSSSTSSSLLSSSSVVCNAGERRSDCSASSGNEGFGNFLHYEYGGGHYRRADQPRRSNGNRRKSRGYF